MREIRHIGDFWQPSFAAVAVAPRATVAAPVSIGHAARGWRERAQALRARLTAEWLVALLASVMSIAAYAHYANTGQLFAYGDAVSHLMIARQVLASRTPGLAQLGAVWLPLTHLLMLPLVWNDTLWRDGFAGGAPSMAAFVAGGVFLYRIALDLTGSRPASWIAALVFLLNPNVLYMQSTAMTELPLLCTEIVAVYYLQRWAQHASASDLVKAAAAAAAGTLIRYDGWALVLALAAVVLVVAWRRAGRATAEAHGLLFGVLGFAGCAAWLMYNVAIFHDPLYFFDSPYSARGQQQAIEASVGLPTHNNLLLSIHIYAQSVVDSVGLPVVIFACCGLVLLYTRRRFNSDSFAVYATLVPFVFNCLSLVRGVSIMQTPEVPISGLRSFFNARYGMMMIPAVALFVAVLAAQRWRTVPVVLLAIVLVLSSLPLMTAIPYVLQEPVQGVLSQGHALADKEGHWLAAHYSGGGILISGGDLQSTIFYSGLPYREFLTSSSEREFADALAHPELHVAWIAVDPSGSNYDPVWAALKNRSDWRHTFVLRGVFGTAQVYQRIDTLTGSPSVAAAPTGTPGLGPAVVATPNLTVEPTLAPTYSPTPTATPTPAPTASPTPKPAPSPTPTPTPTPTPSPSPTPSPTPTPTPMPTPTT